MTRLSFCHRKATNGLAVAATAQPSISIHVNCNCSGGAADSCSSPTLAAEVGPPETSCPFQDRICVPTYPAGFDRGSENLSTSGLVGAGSISQRPLSSSCPSPQNTALPCTETAKICETPPTPFATSTLRTVPIIKKTKRMCHACRLPILRSKSHINLTIRNDEYRYYHTQCFTCMHCSAPIDPQRQAVCSAKLPSSGNDDCDDDDEHPLHQECFCQHFGYMCVVCEKPLPMVTTVTKIKTDDRRDDYDDKIDKTNVTLRKNAIVQYITHPYFVTERMCPHHASTTFSTTDEFDAPRSKGGKGIGGFEAGLDGSHHTTTCEKRIGSIRRCAGCHRFEPKYASPSKHFVDVGDSNTGRCLCLACIRTVVVTNDDIVPLWEEVSATKHYS